MIGARAAAACAIGLALAAPRGLAAQWGSDTVAVHSLPAGEPLLKLLHGMAALVKGAYVPDEADRIHREASNLKLGPAAHQQQLNRSYSYLVRDKDDENSQGVLHIQLLTTQPSRFDVRLWAHPPVMKAIRKLVSKLGVDSLSPIDRVRLVLKDESPAVGVPPRLVLSLETVGRYPCQGSHIDHDLQLATDTVRLNLHGVASPDGCLTPTGPARLSRDVFLRSRNHAVWVSYRERTDRLFFNITDTMTVVTSGESDLVEADQRPRLRYPRNSFVLRCGGMPRALALCNEVDEWLSGQRGISRYNFPEGGINPYRPAPASRPDEAVRFFQYDLPSSFEYLRFCFDAITSATPAAEGVPLTLEDWVGNSMNAIGRTEIPGRYSHRDVPGPVAGLPACQAGSEREPSW